MFLYSVHSISNKPFLLVPCQSLETWQDGLRPVMSALQSGCRCISLALMESASELQAGGSKPRRVQMQQVLAEQHVWR